MIEYILDGNMFVRMNSAISIVPYNLPAEFQFSI